MDFKKIVETYLSIIKTKYICFQGTATQQELIYFLVVWVIVAFGLGIIAAILGAIDLTVVGAILCGVWNLANLIPGIGTIVRFLNGKKAE